MSDYLDANNEELLRDFFSEAEQQVETLESNILVIENDPSNHDAIDEIFRAAHTLKGGSATVEMTELATFCHDVEDLLDEYNRASNKNFTVSYMDLSKEENRDLAESYGLTQVQIQEYNNNEFGIKSTYMGLAITYGDSLELIDPITSTDGVEYKITSTISKMINTAASLENLKGDDKINLTVILSNPIKSLRISGVDEIESEVEKVKAREGVKEDTQISAEGWKSLIPIYKNVIKEVTGKTNLYDVDNYLVISDNQDIYIYDLSFNFINISFRVIEYLEE